MDLASVYYLGTTFLLFGLFAGIVVRVCSRKRKERVEAPKYRMMHDE
ncbi:MAG TPA: cbb3-type cytochrome c oxidase subunit 3 [Geobacteraceae bacterium]